MTLQNRRPTSPRDLADAKEVVIRIKDRIQDAYDENKPCNPIGQEAIDWLLAIPEVAEEVRQTLLPAISPLKYRIVTTGLPRPTSKPSNQ